MIEPNTTDLVADAANRCTQCGVCEAACTFLKSYDMVIGDVDKVRQHAFSCFQCGRCTQVCPEDIDGCGMIAQMRCEHAGQAGEAALIRQSDASTREKVAYPFKNYRHANASSVFFPGCGLTSVLPRTTKQCARVLYEEAGVGVVYDCCAWCINGIGGRATFEPIVAEIDDKLDERGVDEVVVACPHCKEAFVGRLNKRVVDVYAKLQEIGFEAREGIDVPVYVPCPDRKRGEWRSSVSSLLGADLAVLKSSQCCGCGGSAGAHERDLSLGMASSIVETACEGVGVYCANCARQIASVGGKSVRVTHALSAILGIHEEPCVATSFFNRARSKFW